MFPYAAKLYRDYVASQLDGIRVCGDVPVQRPSIFVTVQTAPASGSAKPKYLAWRRLIFQVYGSKETEAGQLCEKVRDIVVRSVYAHIGARRVLVIGEPARFDDPEIPQSRFQTTIDVLLRANL